MPTDRPSQPGAEHRLAVRKLFDAVFTFAWRALDRSGVSAVDREDIAQNVAIAALRRWPTYRERSGTPGQWLWGIVRNEHRMFLRAQGRQPILAGDDLLDFPSEAPDPERGASLHDLADQLLAMLPIDQRRVKRHHEIVGLTYREIAAFEGISKSEAHERHKTGLQALSAATFPGDVSKRRSAAAPLALFRGSEPSPQARDAAWQRSAVRLGLPSPAPRSSWSRRAVAVAVALVCGLTVGSTPERDPGRAPAADTAAAPHGGFRHRRGDAGRRCEADAEHGDARASPRGRPRDACALRVHRAHAHAALPSRAACDRAPGACVCSAPRGFADGCHGASVRWRGRVAR